MAKKDTIKERILALERIFQTGRTLTVDEIEKELEAKHGITVDRKTVYSDIKALDKFIPITIVRRCVYQLQSAFYKNQKNGVDTSLCESCFYYRCSGQTWTCDYILIEDRMRPCPPGKDCTEYKKKKRHGRKDHNHE